MIDEALCEALDFPMWWIGVVFAIEECLLSDKVMTYT
jgi:hypothetical protein